MLQCNVDVTNCNTEKREEKREKKREESEKDIRNTYGEFKRIKLTDSEYEKLITDYSKDLIDNQIIKLDEYVESNNNKNKYTNFNIVLRKSIKEKWFEKNKQQNNQSGNIFMDILREENNI
jgi:hypothetical protein